MQRDAIAELRIGEFPGNRLEDSGIFELKNLHQVIYELLDYEDNTPEEIARIQSRMESAFKVANGRSPIVMLEVCDK